MHPPAVTEGWPLHARFDGPIVMIGFGSIGRAPCRCIERHIAFDRSKFVVIAPEDSDRSLLDERQIQFIHQALTKDNYREILTPLLTAGPGPRHGREPVGRHLLGRPRWSCARISTPSTSTPSWSRGQASTPTATVRSRSARTMRCARACSICAGGARRHHRRELLRRQSRHGVVDGEAGAGRHRRASSSSTSSSRNRARIGVA